MGSEFNPSVTHGPQISRAQRDCILIYVESAKYENAKLILGGSAPSRDGYFMQPTIFFKDTNRRMKSVREEIFGAFVVIQSFSSNEDPITKANDTEYSHKISSAIQAGMICCV